MRVYTYVCIFVYNLLKARFHIVCDFVCLCVCVCVCVLRQVFARFKRGMFNSGLEGALAITLFCDFTLKQPKKVMHNNQY